MRNFLPTLFKYTTYASVFCALMISSSHADTNACGGNVACAVGDRSYHAALPDSLDNEKPLPVLIHFHGWGRTGQNVINNERVAGAARDNNVLLLAPNGLGKSWSFWRSPSRDVPFVEAMLDDAAKRFSIDRSRIYVSGFSYGGAMAWRLACERGADFTAFLPIAGTLWNLEELTKCSAPIELRHVHGLQDTVMDLPVGPGGDPRYAVSPWIVRNGCQTKPDQFDRTPRFERYIWRACAEEKGVVLDIHKGGHWIPKGWLKQQLSDLLGQSSS